MARKRANDSLIADRYVAALFPLAEKENAADTLNGELRQLAELVADNADFARLATSPVIAPAQKAAAIEALLKGWKASPLTLRFAVRLASAGRLGSLPAIAKAFAARISEARGQLTVQIVSAKPLSSAEQKALTDSLGGASGKTVAAEVTVDPALIAGVIVKTGSKQLDYSLLGRMKRLSAALQPGQGAQAVGAA